MICLNKPSKYINLIIKLFNIYYLNYLNSLNIMWLIKINIHQLYNY